ncbi:MAG: gamma-glutamyltransferase 1 [Rhizobacter sp.]|nr:gamma-glutamyltransferase 1 [Rhizobacter sp.]
MKPIHPRTPVNLGIVAGMLSLLTLSACGGSSDDPTYGGNTCLQVASNGTVYDPVNPGDANAPEIATGYQSKLPGYSRHIMAVAANPIATKVACDVLNKGGTAVDAAVATQMALNLVEPQSSGIGGGAFMLHYDARAKKVTAYDGRETAPAAATGNYLRWISDTQQTAPVPSARASGRSIGTPGVLRMLELAHNDAGRLAWKDLFEPGIKLATDGFKISPRMSDSIAGSRAQLAVDPEAAAYFLNADGSAKAAGTLLKSPALAAVYTAIADKGVSAFYTGPLADAIVAKIGSTAGGMTPGVTTLADLAAYKAKKRESVCTTYRAYWVCGMPPPSSGGITVASALGVLENFSLASYAPTAIDAEGGKPTVLGVHLISEAERLAYADRDKYIADTDFVPLPGGTWDTMLNKTYMKDRAGLVSLTASMGVATAGNLGAVPLGVDKTPESGTTHMSLVDRYGNVVVMTTTVESGFGSFHFTNGFILNNQLTDFSAQPADAASVPIANRVAPGKRPRSSMAPTLVFTKAADGTPGDFVMATGSPGGSTIIQYVVKTLVGSLDWGLNAQQSVSMIDFGASNSRTTSVGGEHPNVIATDSGNSDPLVIGLRALGHTVSVASQSSGLGSIVKTTIGGSPAYVGGADPRREGIVMGDTFTPAP